MENQKENTGNEMVRGRREVLKKAGKTLAFAIPTIITFKVAELHAIASEPHTPKGGHGI